MKPCALCIVQKCSHHLAPCHTLHLWWTAHLHLALALLPFPRHDLPQLPLSSFPADPRHVSIGHLAEPTTFTGYEPKHLTGDKDLAEHEDLGVKPSFFHRPSTASTHDSAESIATPPSCVGHGRWANSCSAGFTSVLVGVRSRSQVYHSVREKLDVPKSTERPVALSSSKSKSNKETFSDRRFFLRTSTGIGKQWTVIQILLYGKFCKIALWGSQRSYACGSEIWNPEARM